MQVIPHITGEIRERIHRVAANSGADVVIGEVGGSVSAIESLPFLDPIREFRGALVSQDSCDEPASERLARSQAARQAEAAAGKPSWRGCQKAADNPEPSLVDAAPVPPDLLCKLLRE